MDKRFLAILGVIVVGFFGFILITKQKDDSSTNNSAKSGTASNHVYGNPDAAVTFLEYADFQCPACGQFHSLIQEVKAKYKDQVAFVYKNFPIDSIHPNARSAHRAAEAAGKQGKFYEMHDLLYENQTSWSSASNSKSIFEGYANQLGLNIDQFNSDYLSELTNDDINADINEGKSKGVVGTPTFFLNGTELDNNDLRTVELLSAKIDAAIAASAASQAPADTSATTPN